MYELTRDWLDKGVDPIRLGIAGDLFCTSGVPGIDPATGRLPADPDEQFAHAFANLEALLAADGIAPEEVGLVTVYIPSRDQRPHIDPPWLALFADEICRPARKTTEVPLPAGLLVQLQATGIRGGTCRSVEIPGLRHRAPLPMGALVGSTLFSSVIGGDDPATGQTVAEPAAQIAEAFRNAARLMEQAGGDAGGINHIWAFMGDMGESRLMLDTYLAAYPDAASRPARKTLPYALPGSLAIQLQISGDVGGRSANFEVDGVGHHDPIPLISKAGRLVQSSGIHGIDPATSRMAEGGIGPETRHSLDIIERAMEKAGGSLASIAGLTVMVRHYADAPWLTAQIAERFPDGAIPALRFVTFPLPEDLVVQFHVTAWI